MQGYGVPGIPKIGSGHDNEVVLFDATGAPIRSSGQIFPGRLRRRDWLDPDPDAAAFAETCEFVDRPELGTVASGNTEAADLAKWTPDANCSVQNVLGGMAVIGGVGASGTLGAYQTVNLTGDFDIMVALQPVPNQTYSFGDYQQAFIGMVAGSSCFLMRWDNLGRFSCQTGGTYVGWSGLTHQTYIAPSGGYALARLTRKSGTLYMITDSWWKAHSRNDAGIAVNGQWAANIYYSSFASTIDKLYVGHMGMLNGVAVHCPFVRRFA